jgi:hypothetical protein
MQARVDIAVAVLVSVSCGSDASSTSPTPPPTPSMAAVNIVFQGPTSRRTDLPVSAQGCLDGVGATHVHPSWRNFAGIPLTAVPPSRYELSFADVPVNTRVTFRVNDQNFYDENPTGAVTRNVLVNNVTLIQNTTTPGNGDEPGYAFSVTASGTVTQ